MVKQGTDTTGKSGLFRRIGEFFGFFFKPGGEKQVPWSGTEEDVEKPNIKFVNKKGEDEAYDTVNERLERVLDAVNAIEAKRIIFQFIEEKESDSLTEEQKRSLESYYHTFLSQLNTKKNHINVTVEHTNLAHIETFIGELQSDNATSTVVKRAIVKEILGKLEGLFAENRQKVPSVMQRYVRYLKRLEWELKSEIRIITYTVKTLMKTANTKMRKERLVDLGRYISSKIKDKKLRKTAETIFQTLSAFYRIITDNGRRVDVSFKGADSGVSSSTDDEKLPDFGEEEEEFLRKLEQNENPSEIAVEIERYPETEKADLIEKLGFDKRFDRYFEGIVDHLNEKDMGKLIGIVMTKLKKVEHVYGKRTCEDYIEDLANRLVHRIGEESMIVRRIRHMKLHLGRVNKEWTLKLDELKRRLRNKNIVSQLAILQEMACDQHYSGIFGTVQNMERLTVEQHFDEIFSGLPLETQKIIAENLLGDLGHLRQYYPHLIKKLEHKLETAKVLLRQMTSQQPEPDDELLDTIVDFSESIKTKERSWQDEIRDIEKEIGSIPSLKEKITTLRFWLNNNYFDDQPQIQQCIENMLQSLESCKVREGGLLRDIFDHLGTLGTNREKVLYLEKKLDDAEYYHLSPTLHTIIENIGNGVVFEPEDISGEWILSRLNEIEDPHFKLDWLQIRRYLPAYQEYASLIQYHIDQIEAMLNEDIEERLENEFYDNMDISPGTEKGKVHENIITLTRAVLKLPGKVKRRQYIKKQERLKPLPADNIFQKQRKLLYYILNTENDERPETGIKVLADKVLLSFAEKREYLKILKLSRYKVNERIITLQDELGISDEHIAYYATYILGCDKPSLEARITFIGNFLHNSIIPKDIAFTSKQGETVHQPYKTFFSITPQIVHRVLGDMKTYLKKHLNGIGHGEIGAETDVMRGPGRIDESPPSDELTAGETEVLVETDEPVVHVSEESDSQSDALVPETDTFTAEQVTGLENEDHTVDEETVVFEEDEGGKEEIDIESLLSSGMKERDKTWDDEQETSNRLNNPDMTDGRDLREKEDEAGQPAKEDMLSADEKESMALESETYRINKITIDRVVREHLIENGKKKLKTVDNTIRKVTLDAIEEKSSTLEERIRKLFYDLSGCFPEAIPELISQTMLPVFVEKGIEDERDILNAVNQNIFIPVLYNGADVSIDSTIESIETFLNRQGVLKEIRKFIYDIVTRMKKVRLNEITRELEKKGNNIQQPAEVRAGGGKGIGIHAILKCLCAIENPQAIITHLQEKYIDHTTGKPEYAHLEKKLLVLKNILTTTKMINWDMVRDHCGEEAAAIIERLKIKIMNAQERDEGKEEATSHHITTVPVTDREQEENGEKKDDVSVTETKAITEDKKGEKSEEKGNIIPDCIEAALVNMEHFTNPHQVIQQSVASDARLKEKYGGLQPKERQYVVSTLFNAGKIFTYDNKRYIGFGKINAFIHDKHNVGYDKKRLARELFVFLRKFPTNSTKAKFLGIHEKELQKFITMLNTWTTSRDTDMKGRSSSKTLKQKKDMHITRGIDRRKHDRRSTSTTTYSGNDRRKEQRRGSERRKTITDVVSKKKNRLPVLTQRRSSMLKNANELITDKLIFFIKHYNGKEPLKMLYDSYVSPHSPPRNLLTLIDKNRHGAIYHAIKDDDGVLDRLSFDRSKVMKAYNKKLKKVKK